LPTKLLNEENMPAPSDLLVLFVEGLLVLLVLLLAFDLLLCVFEDLDDES
jgi:hypothetical protein